MAKYARDVIPSLKHMDKGYPLFWFNPNKVYGFRMTNRAMNILTERSYAHWTFVINTAISSKTIVLMDQKIMHPYHINHNRFTTYNEQFATAMNLCNNDIDTAVNLVYC